MKNIRKFISVLLALVFVLSLLPTYTFADSADKSSKVEKLTAQQFPAIDKPVTIDSKNPLAAQLEGLFETPLKVEGDSDRKIAQYFPRNLSYRQPEVALHVPSGKDYETFFQTSGWKDVADDNGIVVALMIPGANGWKDDETAYSEAAYKFMDARTYYQAQDSAFYLVGYEKGAKVAMSVAAMHADRYAGVAGFGLDDMDVSVLKKAAEAESGAKGVMQSEVAVPVWIGAEKRTDNVNALVEFWKNANECGDEATSGKYADEIYEFPKYLATTNELTYSHASKVMVTIGKDYNNKEFTKNLYGNFLKRVRRQDSGDINSLRSFATNRELGMDYATMDVNGTTREFYVYVPSSVKSGRLSNVPVVFAFHGGGGSGEE
ncbi:MAG: hypothetical protein K0R31_2284, partial [Clostridiales bacterium]|nr:hypothetical protein [Clostridiales bacterium]